MTQDADQGDTALLPPLVREALRLAAQLDFHNSSAPEVGRLLRTLAALRPTSLAGETGTGTGVGSAWILSGLQPGGRLVTVEQDLARAEAARRLFAIHQSVSVLVGDWRLLLPHGPFDLLFADGGKRDDPDALVGCLRPGGIALLDDLTPGRPVAGDPVREFWLRDTRLAGVELQVSPTMAVILATRVLSS